MSVQNVSVARENHRRHAWAQRLVRGWREDVAYALAQDRDFFERMIPELTPWPEYGQNCPACVGRLSAMGETGLYEWDVRRPDKLVCKYCDTQYPNEDYPETGCIVAVRMGQTFTFYLNDAERAHPNETGGEYAYRWVTFPVHTSWSGVLRSKRGRWCLDRVLPLARLYALTGDRACAERAAWIMDIAARRYPRWLFHSYDGTYADCPPAEAAAEIGRHPRGGRFAAETIVSAFEGRHRDGDTATLFNGFWGAGRFGCSGGDAGMLLELALAYDLVRDVLPEDMEDRIVNDLLLAGCDDMECWDEINNKCPPGRALSALCGRLFGRPHSVRRAIDGFDALLKKGFYADGCCTESPSYADMFLNLMRPIPDLLDGYRDPPDYAAERIVDYDPYAEFGRYRLALENMIRMLDPNLHYPVIGDTHFGSGLQPIHAEVLTAHYGKEYAGLLQQTLGAPLTEAGDEYALFFRDPDLRVEKSTELPLRTEWFPDWRVGVLRGGGGDAFYFNGYAQDNHRHADTLGISYIAAGKELAADRGYIWDDPRGAWTKGTLAHNIVAVDGQNQDHPDRGSTLELFGRGPDVEVVQAAAQAYTQCEEYRRTCALVRLPGGGSYAVDFFRVKGGRTHHYAFHCNGTLEGVAGADLAPMEEGEAHLTEWLQWVQSPGAGKPTGPVKATWAYEGTRLNLHLPGVVDRLLIADAPGWRSCHGSQLEAPPVQQLLAERQGGQSRYAALMVPYAGDRSPIGAVRLLGAEGALGLEVVLENRTDYILSAPDGTERDYGPVALAGRFGFVSVDADGKPLQAYLLDGTRLSYGDAEWRLSRGRTRFGVEAVDGQALRAALPEELPPCAMLLADGTGYDVEAVDAAGVRVRAYPPVSCDEAELLHALVWRR